MLVLITGANGFLGHYLTPLLLRNGYNVIATGKGPCRLNHLDGQKFSYIQMDFTDPFAVHDVFENCKPDVVVHAGALSKPDECELDQWKAYTTNVEATVTLLNNAEQHQSFVIFLSTDFIFDGLRGMYVEDDIPNPVNYYGRTKLEGEEAVREYKGDWAIVRTVLVYGKPIPERGNLLSIVKEKLDNSETYSVFSDQVRTPTYVGDLAAGIEKIISKRAKGVWHLSGKEVMTPYEMAIETARFLGKDESLIKEVSAENLSQPAKRPLKTGFIIQKAQTSLGYDPISFREGLVKTFRNEN